MEFDDLVRLLGGRRQSNAGKSNRWRRGKRIETVANLVADRSQNTPKLGGVESEPVDVDLKIGANEFSEGQVLNRDIATAFEVRLQFVGPRPKPILIHEL